MADRLFKNDKTSLYLMRFAFLCAGMAAFIWLMKTGTPIFLPLIVALVFGVVFAPVADFFARLGAPAVIGALAALMVVLFALLAGGFVFYPVVAEFILRIPLMWAELQDSLSGLKATMQNVENVQKEVINSLGSENTSQPPAEEAVSVPGMTELIGYVPSIAAQIMIFVGILYFFLLARLDVYEYVESGFPNLSKRALRRAEAEVSRYFLAITAINAAFGVLVTLMLSVLDMPNAMYWGLGAFLLNFVLYLGPITFAAMLVVAGLIVFDGPMSFAPAGAYLLMNMTEGQFVTPSLVGRHMSVNPLLIFVSLVFWLWLWGPLGGVIAIPTLVWLRQVRKAMPAHEPEGLTRTPPPAVVRAPQILERQHDPAG